MKIGKYILIEGGEGCGKGTQLELLYKYLQQKGVGVVRGREPGGVKEAEEIRKILLDKTNVLSSETELFLFEAARTEFFRQFVIPNLKSGKWVLADRSGYSTEAYQGYAGGINLNLIQKLNNLATQGVMPDLVFLLDVEASKGLRKETDPDRFAAKGIEYHQKVNAGYRQIAAENKSIFVIIPYIEGGSEIMHRQIVSHIHRRFGI